MKAGAVRVGKQIHIPTDAVRIAQQGAGSRWFCWVARVGPVRQRCYGPSLLQSARHHLCLQVTGLRNKKTRFVGKKAQWSVVSVTEAGGMKVVGVR